MREAVLAALAAEPEMRRRVAIDIDPVSISVTTVRLKPTTVIEDVSNS